MDQKQQQEQQQIHFNQVKVIIFDLDRTLFDWDQVQVFARLKVDPLLEYYGVDPYEFWIIYDKYHDGIYGLFLQQQLTAHAYRIERYAKPLEKFNIFDRELANQFNQCFIKHALNQARFCEGAQELLNACKQSGYKMALLTNGPAHGQRQKIENLKLTDWMSKFYISEEREIAKPNAEAFLQICQDFQVEASQCLMVGDDLNIDILPALQLGMQVFWVENRTITQQYGDLKSQSIQTLSAILNGQ